MACSDERALRWRRIARQGTGSMRDSISLLDQIVTDPDEVDHAGTGGTGARHSQRSAVRDWSKRVIDCRMQAKGCASFKSAIDHGSDPRQFGQQTVEHLRAVLLAQTAGPDLIEASEEIAPCTQQQGAASAAARSCARSVPLMMPIAGTRGGWQPQLALELALVERMRGVEGRS